MIPPSKHLLARRLCAAALLAVTATSPALAQDTAAPAPTEETERQPGQPYFKEDIGDWRIRCVAPPPNAGSEDVCQLYQLLLDSSDNPVSEFTILPAPEGGEGGAIATIVTPLETLLPPGLRMAIDDNPEQVIPYTWCSNVGCYARFRLAPADIDALKAGGAASIGITPLAAPDQQVSLRSSLSGFTRAYDSIKSE